MEESSRVLEGEELKTDKSEGVQNATTNSSVAKEIKSVADQNHDYSHEEGPIPGDGHHSKPSHEEPVQLNSEKGSVANSNQEDMQQVDSDNLNGTALQTKVVAPKKRLTLQERLALAAKGRKLNTSASSSASSSAFDLTLTDPSKSLGRLNVQEGSANLRINGLEHVASKEVSYDEGPFDGTERNQETPSIEYDLSQLRLENDALKRELGSLKSENLSRGTSKEVDLFKEQLKVKDKLIEDLRREGEALSVKELKLNETIKRLKLLNRNNEEALQDFAHKNDEMQTKISDIDEILKKTRTKTVEQLSQKYSEINLKLDSTQKEYEDIKKLDWENKYINMKALYEEEIDEKNSALKELADLNIKHNMIKVQQSLDLGQKESVIKDLKYEISMLKDQNSREVQRLENKIEELRIETEMLEKGAEVDLSQDVNLEHSKIFDDYNRLKQKSLESQEEWKRSESDLANKTDTLSQDISKLRESKNKLQADFITMKRRYEVKLEEILRMKVKVDQLKKEKDDALFEIELKQSDIQDLQIRLQKLQALYNSESVNKDSKLTRLKQELESLKTNQLSDSHQKYQDQLNFEYGLNTAQKNDSLSSLHIRQTDVLNNQVLTEMRMEEESFNLINDKEQAEDTEVVQNLSDTAGNDLDSTEENDSLNTSKSSKSFGNITGLINPSANSSIPLINRMSSNVRRLEIELQTIRDENSRLLKEKEETEVEFLKLMRSRDDILRLQATAASLRKEIEQREEKEQTMLEIIGEKSEEVDELKADIQDLKALCRSQVEQLVDARGGN